MIMTLSLTISVNITPRLMPVLEWLVQRFPLPNQLPDLEPGVGGGLGNLGHGNTREDTERGPDNYATSLIRTRRLTQEIMEAHEQENAERLTLHARGASPMQVSSSSGDSDFSSPQSVDTGPFLRGTLAIINGDGSDLSPYQGGDFQHQSQLDYSQSGSQPVAVENYSTMEYPEDTSDGGVQQPLLNQQ